MHQMGKSARLVSKIRPSSRITTTSTPIPIVLLRARLDAKQRVDFYSLVGQNRRDKGFAQSVDSLSDKLAIFQPIDFDIFRLGSHQPVFADAMFLIEIVFRVTIPFFSRR